MLLSRGDDHIDGEDDRDRRARRPPTWALIQFDGVSVSDQGEEIAAKVPGGLGGPASAMLELAQYPLTPVHVPQGRESGRCHVCARWLAVTWLSEAQNRARPSGGLCAGGGWSRVLDSAAHAGRIVREPRQRGTLGMPAVLPCGNLRGLAMRPLRWGRGGRGASPLLDGHAAARTPSRFNLTHHAWLSST